MKISQLSIDNFRGVRTAHLLLPDHAVLIGDNNTGKSTILEALDLVLGPDRLSRLSPIDEHDFHLGRYLQADTASDAASSGAANDEAATGPPQIVVTATVTGLSEEQRSYFGDYIEWWDASKLAFYDTPDPAGLDASPSVPALRITFIGNYDPEEDDFEGKTYFTRTLEENETPAPFTKRDKQKCGFLQVGIERIALPFVTELGQMAGGIGTGCRTGTDPSRWLPAGHFRKKLCGETDVLLVIGRREFCVYDILSVAVADYAVSGTGNRFHKLRLAFRQRTGSEDVRGGVCLLEFPHQAPNAVDCAISPVGISIGVENSCRKRIAHGADT